MRKEIAVTKDPRWMRPLGLLFMMAGGVAAIPFKAENLELFDTPLYALGVLGVLMMLRASQKIGWRLNLEGNVLYYCRFNMHSTWKQRRSEEFALAKEKITNVSMTSSAITFHYEPGRKLSFNTRGLDSLAHERLKRLRDALKPNEE